MDIKDRRIVVYCARVSLSQRCEASLFNDTSSAGKVSAQLIGVLTCSRPEPSSKMGSCAAALSSSVRIFPPAAPRLLPTLYKRPQAAAAAASEGRLHRLPGGAAGSVTSVSPSAARRCPVSRWRRLWQTGIVESASLDLRDPRPARPFGVEGMKKKKKSHAACRVCRDGGAKMTDSAAKAQTPKTTESAASAFAPCALL